MGYEDEGPSIEEINDELARQRNELELTRQNTIATMEKNKAEDEAQRQKLKALSNTLGINQIREDLDSVKTNINYLAERLAEMVKAINNVSAVLSNSPPPQVTDQPQNKINMIGELLSSPLGDKILSKIFPENNINSIAPLISQDLINEKMTSAFMQDLETGESIRKFIADTLKKKATQVIVKTALSDISPASKNSDEPA